MSVTIRKATAADVKAVAKIYEHIHDAEEKGIITTGWVREIYPKEETAQAALERGDLFVEELDGKIVGAAILNQTQVDVYADTPWQFEADDDQVLVMHTLVIDPYVKGQGLGKAFLSYYEQYAREHGCSVLRIDTNARNEDARAIYAKLGYREAAILPCVFSGIPDVNLVMLEKKLGLDE